MPVRFPESELAKLDHVVAVLGASRSHVIRTALDLWYERAYHTGSQAARNDPGTPAGAVESGPPPPVTPAPAPSFQREEEDEIEKLLRELE